MKRKHKIYSRPKKPFDKVRIIEEEQIKKEFGLKNKKEIWRSDSRIKVIRGKIAEARVILDKIQQLKHEEESELEIWRNELDNVDKKVGFISETLAPTE